MINLKADATLNFLTPNRIWVPYAFAFLIVLISVAFIVNVILCYRYFSLGKQIEDDNVLLARYEDLSASVSLPENIDLKLQSFKQGLDKIEQLGINVTSSEVLLSSLEKSKSTGIMYSKIEYNGLANRCLLEFVAVDSSAASELLKKLEGMPIFKSVTILQRDRLEGQEKYLVDIRI